MNKLNGKKRGTFPPSINKTEKSTTTTNPAPVSQIQSVVLYMKMQLKTDVQGRREAAGDIICPLIERLYQFPDTAGAELRQCCP